MLQHTGACHGSLFRHMSYNKNGNAIALCQLEENPRGLPYLGNASRRCGNLLLVHGLDGVYNHDFRLLPGNRLFYVPQVGFTQKLQGITEIPDSLRPHFNLLQGLLPGNIKYLFLLFGQEPAHLQQQGGFPDSRISSHKHKGSGDNSAAQHPVQLSDSRQDTLFFFHGYFRKRTVLPCAPRQCSWKRPSSPAPPQSCSRYGSPGTAPSIWTTHSHIPDNKTQFLILLSPYLKKGRKTAPALLIFHC